MNKQVEKCEDASGIYISVDLRKLTTFEDSKLLYDLEIKKYSYYYYQHNEDQDKIILRYYHDRLPPPKFYYHVNYYPAFNLKEMKKILNEESLKSTSENEKIPTILEIIKNLKKQSSRRP